MIKEVLTRARRLVTNGDLGAAAEMLTRWLDVKVGEHCDKAKVEGWINELMVHQTSLRTTLRKARERLITGEREGVEIRRIAMSILKLINEMESEKFLLDNGVAQESRSLRLQKDSHGGEQRSGGPAAVGLEFDQTEKLVAIMAKMARSDEMFLKNLISRIEAPQVVKGRRIELLKGHAEYDARELIAWALNYGRSPKGHQPALAQIILAIFDDAGDEDQAFLCSIIVVLKLDGSNNRFRDLALRFQVPQPPDRVASPVEFGPPITPFGTTDSKTLQGLLVREPDFLDVWLLQQAVERARSVCLIEVPRMGKKGSGVLIQADLILTNFHVISSSDDVALATLQENLTGALVRFGAYRSEGTVAEGQVVALDDDEPILVFSPTKGQDFVLLRAKGIETLANVAPTPFVSRVPAKGSAIHILQHPLGGAMKLALSSNGVAGVDLEKGLVQYVTRTEDGSSGSPCFDADWNLIAIHHAQRTGVFQGVFREGVLMAAIYERIRERLSVQPS